MVCDGLSLIYHFARLSPLGAIVKRKVLRKVLETRRQVAHVRERTFCPSWFESVDACIAPAVARATRALRGGRLARDLSREWDTTATAGETPALVEASSGADRILLVEG